MSNFQSRPITVNDRLIDPVDDEILCLESEIEIDGEYAGPFVSKPTPTFDFGNAKTLHSPAIHCGSGLAREGVRSGEIAVECANAFVRGPLPLSISAMS
ncbi:hypothetical protein [Pseudomonas sp. DTU12.3]|uniref:hypothetical protein n=1 Tax=Pseudomonas sp. DTU12.3 TaxID=2073078 RepID=UPI0013E963B0|nr:hypothetical protein [Pseudomonas sp. DTU12.3]